MGRRPCCPKEGLNRGAWTAQEDKILSDHIKAHGQGKWRSLPKKSGLKRCGKSCRLRWLNYLRPGIKRGNISLDEEELIVRLHKLLGNRWSLIAGRLPGRTDNEIKNYWNTNLGRRQQNNNPAPDDKKTKMTLDAAKLSLLPSKPMNGAEPLVARTKGLNHSIQVVLNIPQPDKPDQLNSDQTSTSTPNKSEHRNGLSSTMTDSDESYNFFMNAADSTLDFNLEDLCLSDLLSCNDFSTPLAHPSDHQHQPAAKIMLYEEPGASNTRVDMHPFATFIDYNEDDQWLG